ncbi:MAG: PrsW family intramembrane metalloprotease, partial [Bacteroidales bacterium]|nr:PrsW family intramembrane metalloprotease [Bacteroidales bacterium]
MNIYLISIAILPVLILAFVVYRQDKFQKEPLGKLVKAFIFGALAILPAAFMESVLMRIVPDVPVVSGVYTGYVVAGCSEELFKLLFLYWAVWRSSAFDEYFDGIVYACFVSLGFACFENISYVTMQEEFASAMATGFMRAVLSVPGHFLFGVMMGYYFSLAKFGRPDRAEGGGRGRYLLLAFVVPMLLHGTFDSLLMIPESMGDGQGTIAAVLFVVLVWFDIRMWKWGIRRIRHLQELSLQQARAADVPQNPFDGFTWD